jgi:hypothetical protein
LDWLAVLALVAWAVVLALTLIVYAHAEATREMLVETAVKVSRLESELENIERIIKETKRMNKIE